MTKRQTIWIPEAIYHVTTRGNRKEKIFREKIDYLVYLDVVKEALDYYDHSYNILAYTLMPNHVHLEIKTEDTHIWHLMSRINKNYARDFNTKYNLVGHLFQSRYNGELIDTDGYLLEASRYIHLNPVRANIVEKPEDYWWSSYSMYIGKRKEEIINSELILKHFEPGKERIDYKKFVEAKNR